MAYSSSLNALPYELTSYTYILYLHPIPTSYTYILYLHPIPTSYTYILYLHPIPTSYDNNMLQIVFKFVTYPIDAL
jgi:hypothetical protein